MRGAKGEDEEMRTRCTCDGTAVGMEMGSELIAGVTDAELGGGA